MRGLIASHFLVVVAVWVDGELPRWSRRNDFWGLLGVTGGAHCVRLLGAELKLLTGVRERLRVVGTPEVIKAQVN